MNRNTNGRSTSVTTVAEVKKSRRLSNSRRLLANAPAEAGRAAMRMPITCSKMPAGELEVGDPAGAVDEVAAQIAQHEIEPEHRGGAGGEHPQRLDRVVRHHPVVDVHDEQGAGQREQVDQDRGQEDLGVDRPGPGERAPEPAAARDALDLVRPAVEAQPRPGEQGVAGIAGRRARRAAARSRRRRSRASTTCARSPGNIPTRTHALRSSSRSTQGKVSSLIRASGWRTSRAAETGALGGAQRQLRRQAAIGQRQTGLERLRRGRALEQLGQDAQAGQQRIVAAGGGGQWA